MKALGGRCAICQREFTATDSVCREITGWERLRDQGGANSIARRKETGRLAHRTCVEMPPSKIEGQLEIE
jgi:hypothetical protein